MAPLYGTVVLALALIGCLIPQSNAFTSRIVSWQANTNLHGRHSQLGKSTTRIGATAAGALQSWESLQQLLPGTENPQPEVILYRDTNGWCPFCERVWVQLTEKGIPFQEELINLYNKPEWYKEMVPTAQTPAIKYVSTGEVLWESMDIMMDLEQKYGDRRPMLPAEGTPLREAADRLMAHCPAFLNASLGVVYSRDPTSFDEKVETFKAALTELDAKLGGAEGAGTEEGPFFLGAEFSVVDAMYVPMLERYAVQIPITAGIQVRCNPDLPNLNAWYDAMDGVPTYAGRVKGDEYSWTAVTSMFMRIFSNGTAEGDPAAKARMEAADGAARDVLAAVRALPLTEALGDADARHSAARKLLANHANVAADATNRDPKSQQGVERAGDAAAADAVLQAATAVLLAPEEPRVEADWEALLSAAAATVQGAPGHEAAAAAAARVVAARLCAPRDMGAAAATALRAVLLRLADQLQGPVAAQQQA
uniref:GST N-terminal domain-containing protein n=1 Tax=Heterosigma akashiwo TaxID=2829 RepID=A0A7S3XUT5_HETAK